jgi:nicotinamidase-related amidase
MGLALLIIDVQKEYMKEHHGTKVYEETLIYINATAKLFRQANLPVIKVKDISEGDGADYDFVDELDKNPKDIEIQKTKGNAFWQTNLVDILKEKQVDYVVLSGTAAEHCVLATYNGAAERGYRPLMLQHGIFATHERGLMDLFWNRPLVSYTALTYMVKK